VDGPARYRWQATLRNEGTLLDVLKHLSRGSSDRQHSQERCLWSDRAVRDVQEAREGHRAKGAHCADGPEGAIANARERRRRLLDPWLQLVEIEIDGRIAFGLWCGQEVCCLRSSNV